MRARELRDVFNHSTKPRTKCLDEMSSLFILVMDGNIYLSTSVLCNCFLLIDKFSSGGKTEIHKTQKSKKTQRLWKLKKTCMPTVETLQAANNC